MKKYLVTVINKLSRETVISGIFNEHEIHELKKQYPVKRYEYEQKAMR